MAAVDSTTQKAAESMAIDVSPVKLSISGEEEELLALKREKENDERQLRKLSRKLHQHANARREARARATSNAAPEQLEADQQTITETFENVQVELDAFLLLMEKLELVRLAERRQAEEYEIMRGRILQSHDETRDAIERLKAELREAEALRERKKEYDVIAERINQLPPRSELNASIAELENEIATIHAEQETTQEILAAKRTMMEDIRIRINEMILHGKEASELETEYPHPSSPTPASPADIPSIRVDGDDNGSRVTSPHPGTSIPSAAHGQARGGTQLNPNVPPFRLGSSPLASPAGGDQSISLLAVNSSRHITNNPTTSSPLASQAATPASYADGGEPEDGEDVEDGSGDVEMGEVSDVKAPSAPSHVPSGLRNELGKVASSPRRRDRAAKEDLEEGEASDGSSGPVPTSVSLFS